MMGLESRSKKLLVASTQSTVSPLGGDRVAKVVILRLTLTVGATLNRAHPPGVTSAIEREQ